MKSGYRIFAYFGLASVFGSLLYGFRSAPDAPHINYALNVILYLAFAAPHLLFTRSWMKQTVWGHPNGSHFERRVYITVSLLLWYAVLVFHLPVSGFTFQLPEWARFIAMLGFLLGVMAFFEGATFANIDGLLGVHGSTMSHSHGPETPLITEGAYSKVRHPMYRAALFAGVCSVFLHGTAASLLWALMIGATFLLFIPIEERQLVAARGDAYREYCKQTPYRLLRGVW